MISLLQMPANKEFDKGTLPNLVIIGAMKSGTTSLHYYLNLHPQISMSREKELDFFIRQRNWHKGVGWYKSHFVGKAQIRGESSPNYTMYPFFDGVAERMHSTIPDARLIYIVRDPIKRIISQYIHNYTDRRDHRTLDEAVRHFSNANPYIIRSKYFMQLEEYFKYFPGGNILVVTAEDLYEQRTKTLQEIFNFLDVDAKFYSPNFCRTMHRSAEKWPKNRGGLLLKWLAEEYVPRVFSTHTRMKLGKMLFLPFSGRVEKPTLNPTLLEELIDYLKDDIDRLREYTGCDFKDWCV